MHDINYNRKKPGMASLIDLVPTTSNKKKSFVGTEWVKGTGPEKGSVMAMYQYQNSVIMKNPEERERLMKSALRLPLYIVTTHGKAGNEEVERFHYPKTAAEVLCMCRSHRYVKRSRLEITVEFIPYRDRDDDNNLLPYVNELFLTTEEYSKFMQVWADTPRPLSRSKDGRDDYYANENLFSVNNDLSNGARKIYNYPIILDDSLPTTLKEMLDPKSLRVSSEIIKESFSAPREPEVPEIAEPNPPSKTGKTVTKKK